MKILSIDVGIKNLAICLMGSTEPNKNDPKNYKIILWDIINLSSLNTNVVSVCSCDNIKKGTKKSGPIISACVRTSKFKKDNKYYCCIHSKNHNTFKIPTSELKMKFLKKLKKDKLYDIYMKYADTTTNNDPINNDNVTTTTKKNITKAQILDYMEKYISQYCFDTITSINAKDISLIDIGIILQSKLDKLLVDHKNINYVLIENQISPLANRMKTIQGMITQYFIMNNIKNIQFISSSNKLKINADNLTDTSVSNESIGYNERKQKGISNTITILNNNIHYNTWIVYFNKHKKKDDLADAFLQLIWFIINKIK
jgi:hypothetical protein